ncbi:SDR family NAD(P)-dependent oxidoreductase [Phenylobacterium sp.]|uniref:SDR family NAD(P)-dependent oxidoreductase n=1 Tax=Phenylobacterium sp. TaxID=1871053 RepID=UPI0025D57AE6|nr:SDR family NAD(P)-dependent oxidoreductase [Phenylobacterium sp.]MBX3482043.1 SDR family oxidoreductase [Phenylobacterium sp.]MCW5758508.1 SDR family oxidoreductase [Phenylobacterium sp.]
MAAIQDLSRSVRGRVVLITGAASGIGRATAHVFAREGARVAVTDRLQADADRVAAEIGAEGGEAHGWALDVADAAAIAAVAPAVADRFGGLDVLVNNAGTTRVLKIDDARYDAAWDVLLPILLGAHQRMVRAALPHLRRSDAPRIVNIASTEALGASSPGSIYSAAKAGVTGLTRSLAVELGREGITVNCICPGPIHTGMTAAIPAEHKAVYARRRTALGRYGDPAEVAHAILNLSLPASSYVTGVTLRVDGGLMVRNA